MPIQHTHFPMIHLSLLQDQEREVSMKKMCTQSSTWKCHENLPEDLMCTKLCPNSTLMIFSIRVLPHPIHGIGQGSVPVLAFSCYLLSGQPSLVTSRGVSLLSGLPALTPDYILTLSSSVNPASIIALYWCLCFEFLSQWGQDAGIKTEENTPTT